MHAHQHKRKVVIAGAGPGDPDLLTIKAAGWLQRADVVVTDRLVSKQILDRYVNPRAEIIFAGKQGRRAASTPQSVISQLLVTHAMQNKLVVRLKGGDVSVFSNILDELQILAEHQIPYEIVPGITAASGASAYTGIPLTARGYSTAIRFLTFHTANVIGDRVMSDLAESDDTLVFYMASGNLDQLVGALVHHNIHANKHIAVVEQATTPNQCVHTCNIYDYDEKLKGKEFISPALVIIGSVVSLYKDFNWLANAATPEEYFDPIQAKWIRADNEAARA